MDARIGEYGGIKQAAMRKKKMREGCKSGKDNAVISDS